MSKKRLLIVDDESDIRDLCAVIILRSFDLIITKAASVKEAKKIIGENPQDLAILDLNLPDGVGFELVAPLKKANDNVKFLFVTAHNQCSDKKKAEELGAVKIIGKPFKSEELINTIRNILNKT